MGGRCGREGGGGPEARGVVGGPPTSQRWVQRGADMEWSYDAAMPQRRSVTVGGVPKRRGDVAP